MLKQKHFATAWRRQVEGKPVGYESQERTIWHDRVTGLDRNPERWAAKDVAKFRRDVFGNRVKCGDRTQVARAYCQRRSALDAEFAAFWRELTPAQANLLVERIAATW